MHKFDHFQINFHFRPCFQNNQPLIIGFIKELVTLKGFREILILGNTESYT